MKEKINQLEALLNEIIELIEQHIEISEIDIAEFDAREKNNPFPIDSSGTFRNTIINHKNDRSFYETDIPLIELLLSNSLKQIKSYKNDLSGSKSKRNRPNKDIIKLIKQGLIDTQTAITGDIQGILFSGFLTSDGFLELDINGNKKRFSSLRRAAITAWGKDIPSQWKFWKVNYGTEEEKPLDYFRNLIGKFN